MTRVLLDTNIILDLALKREPFCEETLLLFDAIDNQLISGYVTASSITDIYYISKKENGHKVSISFLKELVEIVSIVGVGKEVIFKALSSEMKDFEDAVQFYSADMNNISCIITRNQKDFQNLNLKIYTAKEFLATI